MARGICAIGQAVLLEAAAAQVQQLHLAWGLRGCTHCDPGSAPQPAAPLCAALQHPEAG
jgi:hypothetical protein